MLSISQNLTAQGDAAEHKVSGAKRPFTYLVAAMMAGLFIGLADIMMITAAAPLHAAQSPFTPLVQGAVFGIGLALVVFAGGELVTSAMMILPQGLGLKRITIGPALNAFLLMTLGNLLGALVLSAVVLGSGVMAADTTVGQMLAALIAGKTHKTTAALFFRGILCNILVCLAIWTASRTANDVAKIILMSWCLALFVTSGFEHVVANMTTFGLGLFYGVPDATLAETARNLLAVGAGNLVGGCLFVGLPYLLLGWTGAKASAPEKTVHSEAASD